jgi:DNA polymerase III alpha subunit (gram-positive type)
MRLLSFDIECAKVYKNYSPICNFGYVIYDEHFNLIEKKDLVINPNSSFKLEGRKGREDIHLFYSKKEYQKAKSFKFFYNKIKNILENDNQVIVNHAVMNDIIYLNNECKRYHLPIIDFKAYDTMILYQELMNYKGSISLENISKSLIESFDFISHKADEDANAAMLCFIRSCELLDLKPKQILEIANLDAIYSTEINNRYNEDDNNLDDIIQMSSMYENKKVAISISIEKDHSQYENILYAINQLGGELTTIVSESDIFIFNDQSHCKRCDSYIYNCEKGKNITGYNYEEFMLIVNKELHNKLMLKMNQA